MEGNITQQAKDIIKLSYNDKHIVHVLSNEKVNEMTQLSQRYPITRLPVCNHCEALGLWRFTKMKEPAGYCEKCGTMLSHREMEQNCLACEAVSSDTPPSSCSVFDKYRNPDPRCGYPFTPDPCGYCWSYAHHVDETGCKDMDKICPRCELWAPNAEGQHHE